MRPGRIRTKLARVLVLLRGEYGRRRWRRHGSATGVLIGTILSQNTTGANSSAGFRGLRRRFRSFGAMADAPVAEIEKCIRVCGLSRIKAPRIKSILGQIRSRGPDRRISLEFLDGMGVDEATEYLLAFDGVGPKTAACVLMFAFGKCVFPVDTHVARIARRLGVVAHAASPEQVQEDLTPLIAPADRYEMHLLLIAHGRQICRARGPKCDACPLARLCAYGRRSSRSAGGRPRRSRTSSSSAQRFSSSMRRST